MLSHVLAHTLSLFLSLHRTLLLPHIERNQRTQRFGSTIEPITIFFIFSTDGYISEEGGGDVYIFIQFVTVKIMVGEYEEGRRLEAE